MTADGVVELEIPARPEYLHLTRQIIATAASLAEAQLASVPASTVTTNAGGSVMVNATVVSQPATSVMVTDHVPGHSPVACAVPWPLDGTGVQS